MTDIHFAFSDGYKAHYGVIKSIQLHYYFWYRGN
jgi:hypothetical protein